MANRWCDGFGRYNGDEAQMLNGSSGQAWAQVDSGVSGGMWNLSNANPRTGSWHLRMTDGVDEPIARRVFGAPLTEVFFGQALWFERLPSQEVAYNTTNNGFWIAQFRTQTNGYDIGICLGTDGALAVWRMSFLFGNFLGTLLYRSLPVVGAGAYQHFEHYRKIGDGSGAYELRVDERTVINLTGLDDGVAEVSQVAVGRTGGPAFGASAKSVDMADVYCNDTADDGSGCNTFVGDSKSGWLPLTGDTAQADFAKSSGTVGHTLLSDASDSSSVNTPSTVGESDFTLTDTPANLSEILTVRPAMRAMKDDAGTCQIAPNIKSNSIKGTVTAQPITTAQAWYDSNVPFDPNTSVPWVKAGLDAALDVVERTA
jgi:hypothetical protein